MSVENNSIKYLGFEMRHADYRYHTKTTNQLLIIKGPKLTSPSLVEILIPSGNTMPLVRSSDYQRHNEQYYNNYLITIGKTTIL